MECGRGDGEGGFIGMRFACVGCPAGGSLHFSFERRKYRKAPNRIDARGTVI